MLILITILFILGAACFNWMIFQMIQDNQILSGWQKVIDRANEINPFLSDFIGGCLKCFAHLHGLIAFALYLVWQHHYHWLGWWNILIYLGFVPAVVVVANFIHYGIHKLGK